MFNFLLKTLEGDNVMARTKLSKTAKLRNLFAKGADVSWKQMRNTYDLKSPAAMVGKLRNEGMMIYENRTSSGVSYRVVTPSKAILVNGMNAVFGKSISNELNKSRNVWHTDATFKDVSGTANMTKSETDKITSLLSNAGKSFRNIKSTVLNAIATNDEVKMRIKTHFNTLVRQGKRISDTKKHVRELLDYMIDYYDKEIDKRKTARGRDPLQKKKEEAIKFFSKNNMSDIENIFRMMGYIIQAKEMVVKKMDSASSIGTFLKTKKGFVVTNPEGYVAINRDGDAIKLVNRLEFSKANFNSDVIKGWEKL